MLTVSPIGKYANTCLDPRLGEQVVCQTGYRVANVQSDVVGTLAEEGNCSDVQLFEQLGKSVKKLEHEDCELELSGASVFRCNARERRA